MAARHLKPGDGDLAFALDTWARQLGTQLPGHEIQSIVEKVQSSPRLRADNIGKLLKVKYNERTATRITTIGCFDVSKEERARRRKERHRLVEQARRRARGAKTRDQYLADSISWQEPWLAEGVSRATWYRRHPKR